MSCGVPGSSVFLLFVFLRPLPHGISNICQRACCYGGGYCVVGDGTSWGVSTTFTKKQLQTPLLQVLNTPRVLSPHQGSRPHRRALVSLCEVLEFRFWQRVWGDSLWNRLKSEHASFDLECPSVFEIIHKEQENK